jgi:hypothetical protein
VNSNYEIRLVAKPTSLSKQAAAHLYSLDRSIFSTGAPPIDLKNKYWWLVFEGRFPVAFAGLALYYPTRGFLIRAGVLPSARGNKLQQRLIRVRDRAAKRFGLVRNVTYTDSVGLSGTKSSNNLIECGYRLFKPEQEEEPGWLWWFKDIC